MGRPVASPSVFPSPKARSLFSSVTHCCRHARPLHPCARPSHQCAAHPRRCARSQPQGAPDLRLHSPHRQLKPVPATGVTSLSGRCSVHTRPQQTRGPCAGQRRRQQAWGTQCPSLIATGTRLSCPRAGHGGGIPCRSAARCRVSTSLASTDASCPG